MDLVTIVFAFGLGALLFGALLLLEVLVERTAPEDAVGKVSGSARQVDASA